MLMLMTRPGDADADDHDRNIYDGQHLILSYSLLEPNHTSVLLTRMTMLMLMIMTNNADPVSVIHLHTYIHLQPYDADHCNNEYQRSAKSFGHCDADPRTADHGHHCHRCQACLFH